MRTLKIMILGLALVALTSMVAGAYALIDDKWLDPGHPVTYRFSTARDEACITGTGEFDEVRAAFQTWQDLPASDISFIEIASNPTACGLQVDGFNTMSMDDCLSQCTGQCVAVTSSLSWGNGGDATWVDNCVLTPPAPRQIEGKVESDITFGSQWRFGTFADIGAGCQTDACGTGNAFDIRGIATHEIGHLIGLGHSSVAASTMFASVAFCNTSLSSLHTDDIDATTCVYDVNYIPFDIRDVSGGRVRCSLGNAGNIAVSGTGDQTPGQYGASFQFPLGTENVYEASLIFGTSGSGVVSSDYRQPGNLPDNDFRQSTSVVFEAPSPVSDQLAQASFDDSRGISGEAPLGIAVDATMHAWSNAPNDDFIIVCYRLSNTTAATINNLRVGLIMDWDFAGLFQTQSVSWDATNQVGIITEPTTTNVGGVAVLNAEGAATFRALVTTDNYAEAQKSAYLFSGFTTPSQTGVDVNLLIATGDFSIAPGASVFAGFAILGGNNTADLVANVAQARAIYDQQDMCARIITDVNAATISAAGARLAQNVPNPFNPTTRIAFDLERAGMVLIQIFDASGRSVRTLVEGMRRAGTHEVVWDGKDDAGRALASGLYFYTLDAGGKSVSRKMTLLK